MSRVGKSPIKIVKGIKVSVDRGTVKIEGPKGKLSHALPEGISVKIDAETVLVEIANPGLKNVSALHGTTRSVLHNMVHGCNEEFKKELEIHGVGYRAAVKGKTLSLTLGFSHPVDYDLPEGVAAKVDKNTLVTLTSANKVLLGRTAATIRGIKPPEPYQGKGIRYVNETIQKKQGKAAAAAGGK